MLIDPELGPGAMRTLVADFFRHNSATYELRARLRTDLAAMPVEDASVPRPEDLSPHQPVATLTFPAQEMLSEARRIYADDVLSFNPWHALAAHRPLGSANRSRRKAYEASSAYRHTKNIAPKVEPRTLSDLPD
ncbi:hypothetical protein [Streptomyces sp. H27-C3]|uniref:hypothetical protein n=1 Tax=Streptomyces sp. H27-C3 TaxID=3046305 RepID=UPI0024BAE85E|nr:hypothetical protein [Streptomyces sp. H27-C3]MDJ0460563.1 hypothetical protein [Streptomyces sp. H27-C3]